MADPTPRPATPRRRSPEQASGMANALFQSFTAPPPSPASTPAPDPAETSPAPAAPQEPGPLPAAGAQSAAISPAPVSATPAPVAPAQDPASSATEPEPEGAPARGLRAGATSARGGGAARVGEGPRRPAATQRTAPPRAVVPQEVAPRPPRPSRPRLVEPTPYATKHRDVRSARIQALLRESDLDVLDDVSRLTLDQTGEETNRSELLRALVEAIAAAGVAGELAECGTHRARVAFLADRLRS